MNGQQENKENAITGWLVTAIPTIVLAYINWKAALVTIAFLALVIGLSILFAHLEGSDVN